MHGKLAAIIAVLLLVIASLSVCGCTTQTAATHDAFLENYLAAYKTKQYSDENMSVKEWKVTWINNTSASIEWTVFNNSTSLDGTYNEVVTVFPTTQDATNYLNAMNKTAHSRLNTTYLASSSAYEDVAGHAPQIKIMYLNATGEVDYHDAVKSTEWKQDAIYQLDNLIGTLNMHSTSETRQ
jgi:hypothetical protein